MWIWKAVVWWVQWGALIEKNTKKFIKFSILRGSTNADPFPELGNKLREFGRKMQEQIEARKEPDAVLQDGNRKKFVEAIRERWRGKS